MVHLAQGGAGGVGGVRERRASVKLAGEVQQTAAECGARGAALACGLARAQAAVEFEPLCNLKVVPAGLGLEQGRSQFHLERLERVPRIMEWDPVARS